MFSSVRMLLWSARNKMNYYYYQGPHNFESALLAPHVEIAKFRKLSMAHYQRPYDCKKTLLSLLLPPMTRCYRRYYFGSTYCWSATAKRHCFWGYLAEEPAILNTHFLSIQLINAFAAGRYTLFGSIDNRALEF